MGESAHKLRDASLSPSRPIEMEVIERQSQSLHNDENEIGSERNDESSIDVENSSSIS